MSKHHFVVGALVRKKNGWPGKYMVLRLLSNNRASIRRWPLTGAPQAEEAYLADLELDGEPEGQDE